MLERFVQDLAIDGCIIQIGTENQIIDTFTGAEGYASIQSLLRFHDDSNIYFLGGVKPETGKSRASDIDVKKKNYFYFDLDLRKSDPTKFKTDEDIMYIVDTFFIPMLNDHPLLSQWRYVVFTGNGIHIYYFFDPVEVKDKGFWRVGLAKMIAEAETYLDTKIDHSCVNASRIARFPGSRNQKNSPPKDVKIIKHKAMTATFIGQIEQQGEIEVERIRKENQEKAAQVKIMFPLEVDTYKAIQELPVGAVVSLLMGWEFDGKHFFEAGSKRKSACFVPKDENFVVHGGTSHFEPTQTGFRPFEIVKALKKEWDNNAVFKWFRSKYPQIESISRVERSTREKQVAQKMIATGDIEKVFDELQNTNFELLKFDPDFDRMKCIIRGAVTRIGAYSNIGKSKLAYYLAYKLQQAGHRGIIFSTEVPRSIVLANLLTITTGHHFWDLVERRVKIPPESLDIFKNLEIYDVNHTQNRLFQYETLIQRSIDEGHPPSFVVIDFCQGVRPVEAQSGEYQMMSSYALEVQTIAQKYNIAVIDLSQISNEGVKDENAKVGMIPYKGSGALYFAADIGILLKRDKSNPSDNMMEFLIRKHKYSVPADEMLECDFKHGTFKVFASGFPV